MVPNRRLLILVPLLFAIVLAPLFVPPARAAYITANVDQNSVSISMNFELFDNLTTSLPLANLVLDQSSSALQPIQNGFQSASPRAHVDQLTLHVHTAEINNATGLWVLQENYTMTVSGVIQNTGGRKIVDLSFLSSRNNQSISVSGLELNNIGQKYIVQGIQRFPPDSKTRYYAGTGGNTLPLIPEQYAQAFSMFDLSWIPPVQQWAGGYRPFDSSTIWNLQPVSARFNVTVGTGLTTEQTFLRRYTAHLNSSAEIIAPPRSATAGSTILFDIPTPAETVMPVIIVVSIATLIVAFVAERRVSKSLRPTKGRRR